MFSFWWGFYSPQTTPISFDTSPSLTTLSAHTQLIPYFNAINTTMLLFPYQTIFSNIFIKGHFLNFHNHIISKQLFYFLNIPLFTIHKHNISHLHSVHFLALWCTHPPFSSTSQPRLKHNINFTSIINSPMTPQDKNLIHFP